MGGLGGPLPGELCQVMRQGRVPPRASRQGCVCLGRSPITRETAPDCHAGARPS